MAYLDAILGVRMISISRLLLGRALANSEEDGRRISAFEGVPAMGLDALGSASYGPEAAFTVLLPLGAAGLAYIGWIMLPILALLCILYLSYRQTVAAYPSNGGAYTVARENLGRHASLLAAAALMIDYVLNVAVGVSAGIGALTSAVPMLHPHTLTLCLVTLAFITVVNLRGTLDAGRMFAVPAYLFIASFLTILAVGVYRTLMSAGHPQAVVPPPAVPPVTSAVTLFLLLQAFAAGCTAMTGVEAVSNGVSAFCEPVVVRARHTLAAICGVLGVLLAGISYVARSYQIGAMNQTQAGYQSVLSQLAAAIVGHGTFYYIAIGSLLCVLCLSANTSFVDFPRLCRLVAQDDFLPRSFAVVGRRLVFSVGILYLTATAALLLILFGGITDRLIPLFAIGAFLTFTLSQVGMVMHWRRALQQETSVHRRHNHRVSLAINGLGAAATVVALAVIVVAKFAEGAWITIMAIPCVIVLLKGINNYYTQLDVRLRAHGPLQLRRTQPPVILVAIEGWNRITDRALKFAMHLSPDVVAVHLHGTAQRSGNEDEERQLQSLWSEKVVQPVMATGLRPPSLVLMETPYRRMQAPLLEFVENLRREHPDRTIAVLIPQIVKRRWWQYLLHTHRAQRLRSALLRYAGSKVVVMDMPWYLEEPRTDEGLMPEEIAAEQEREGMRA